MAKKRNTKQYGGPLDAQELLFPYNNVNLPQLQDGGFQPLPEGYQHQFNVQFPGTRPSQYPKSARDYNEFFGPISNQLGQMKQTAREAGNKPMLYASMGAMAGLGDYKHAPFMSTRKIPSMDDRGARRMQGLIQGMDPEQINYMGATPPPTDLKSGINYARGLDLRMNQVGPAIESAMYMKKKGLQPPQLGFGDWIGNMKDRFFDPSTTTFEGENVENIGGGGNNGNFGMTGQGMGQAASFGGGMLGGLDFFKREDEISKYKADIDIQGAGRQGALQGATSGFKAGAGMFKNPFLKAGAGIIGGIAGLFGGKNKATKEAEALQEQQNIRIDDTISGELTASRLSSLPTATANIPVAEMGGNLPMASRGGFLRYRGSKHTDPNNGIDVDESGSMSLATGKRPVAKVEDGELSFFDPEAQKPYVLSKKLGFAKQGDKLFKKYNLENRQFGNDKTLDDAITAQFMGLKTKQEDMKKTLKINEPQFEQGLPIGQIGFPPNDNPFGEALYDPSQGGAFGGTRGRVFGQANMDPRYNNVGTMQYNPQFGGAFENMWPGMNVGQLPGGPNFTPYRRAQAPVDRSGMNIQPIEGRGIPTSDPNTNLAPGSRLSREDRVGAIAGPGQAPYSPTLSPLAHALSGAGNIAGYYAMKGARPEEYKPAARGYEQVDYSKERIAAQETADTTRAIASQRARETGNVGLATANQAVARTGVDRLLGQQLSQSIQGQENMNAQLREGATRDNFMAQSQAGLYNIQAQNQYQQQLAAMNPWSTGLSTTASYLADNVKQQNYMTAMRMQNPNMDVYRDPNANWFNWLTANKGFANRYTGEPIS